MYLGSQRRVDCLRNRRQVLDDRVRAREEDALVPVIPANEIRGTAVFTLDGQNQGAPIGISNMVAAYDQPITYCRAHRLLLSERIAHEKTLLLQGAPVQSRRSRSAFRSPPIGTFGPTSK
jgi:hypothetical protein